MNPIRKNPLGRGIEALIPKAGDLQTQQSGKREERLQDIDIIDITPNDQQPRQDFEPEALEALAYSIQSKGVMQPVVVSKLSNGKYMLISGERRWRATALAGLKTIPAIVMDTPSDTDRLELALIENTQRDDLKPLELARAYRNLMDRCSYRQEDVAKIAGKSRSAVANTIRLLELFPDVMMALEQKLITEGHARAFLPLDEVNCAILLDTVLKKNLSVRETEAYAKKLMSEAAIKDENTTTDTADADREALRREIEEFFGSRVNLKGKTDKGIIEIKYSSQEELDRIVNKLRGESC